MGDSNMAEAEPATEPAAEPAAEPVEHADGEKMNGTVKKWLGEKGYGFITPDDASDDVFVHGSTIQQEGVNDLVEGEKVSFTLKKEDDGHFRAHQRDWGRTDGGVNG